MEDSETAKTDQKRINSNSNSPNTRNVIMITCTGLGCGISTSSFLAMPRSVSGYRCLCGGREWAGHSVGQSVRAGRAGGQEGRRAGELTWRHW